MTKEEAKKNLELIKAFAQGKDIQMLEIDGKTWSDVGNPYFTENRDYRIKPDPEYVPWTVENCPLKCGDVLVVKNDQKRTRMVTGTDYGSLFINNIELSGIWLNLDKVFKDFVMSDGTPCGTEVKA